MSRRHTSLCLLLITATAILFKSKRVYSNEIPETKYNSFRTKNTHQDRTIEKLRSAIVGWQNQLTELVDRQKKIEIRFLLAQSYIRLKDYQNAAKELQKITELKPSSEKLALVLEKQGNIEQIKGNRDRAIELYKESLEYGKERSLSMLNNLIEALLERSEEQRFKASQARSQQDAKQYLISLRSDRIQVREYAELSLHLSEQLIGGSDSLERTASSKRLAESWRADVGTEVRNRNKSQEQDDLLSAIQSQISWSEKTNNPLSSRQLARGAVVLGKLPNTRKAIFTTIEWSKVDAKNEESWLEKAVDKASRIDDDYAKSYAKNELGRFYLETSQLKKAIEATKESQLLAESNLAYDSLFRSQSLAGEIYQQIGQTEKAIEAYRGAIASIDILVDRNAEYSKTSKLADFKNDLEPIYRNSLKLLLNSDNPSQEELNEAINIFDKLRLAQLRRYFGDNCFEISRNGEPSSNSPKFNHKRVTINSIVLDDSTYLILQLPDGRKLKSELKIEKKILAQRAEHWKNKLNRRYTWEFREGSRLFYDWIIKPFEAELERIDPEAIVFIHDGILRNLPMAALYDGEKYLAEKWASAVSIGLKFTPTNEEPEELEALAFGLESPQIDLGAWGRLENVVEEIEMVVDYVGGDVFANDEFTMDNFIHQVKKESYSILHLATHGYFSGDAETSFILAKNRKISALELEQILKQSKQAIDLLVLSACETAVGSEESLLGLAGVAARSGVASVIGSLWQVDDENQMEMIEAFYQEIATENENKATALAKAQRKQIELFAHPQKWAALTLIGDF